MIKTGLAMVASLCFFVSCTRSANPTAGSSTAKSSIKVGLVLDKGGKDDRSFNSSAYLGAEKAKNELGVQMKMVESPDDAAFEPALRTFAERGYDLVIAIGFSQVDAVKKVAAQFPKIHFALVDGVVDAPNVSNLLFAEHEGSYVVGYLAGLMTKSNVVGFVGGMDIDMIRRFHLAFAEGARAANPKVEVLVNYIGVNSTAWANPVRGKELALSQIGRGADVLFQAAGASGLGIFDAAEEKHVFAIGCDSNQNGLKPGVVATSMLKRVDTAVYTVIRDQSKNQFVGGTTNFGLKDNGVDYAVDADNEKLIAPYKARLEEVKAKIISGKLKVPDYYLKKNEK